MSTELTARRLVLTAASEIEPLPVRWAWTDDGHGRVPAGALVVAAGREGTGKSSFGIWMAAQITRGLLPGTLYGHPASVIYVAVEDSWKHTLVPRLIAAGADLTKVFRVEVAVDELETVTLSLPVDNRLLEQAIREYNVGLVVLDPLMSTIGEGIDTHRERDTRRALDPLARIADRTGAVVLGIAHFSKAGGTDASTLITGSGAFKNVARAIFAFAADPSASQSVVTQTKNSLGRSDLPSVAYVIETAIVETRLGPAEVGRFDILGVSDRSVADILGVVDPDDEDERHEAARWLKSYLLDNGGEGAAADVYKAGEKVGFSRDTLKRSKKRAGVISNKDAMDRGWMWILRDAASPSPQVAQALTGSDLAEGSTKGAKGAGSRGLLPSLPSVLPSHETDNPDHLDGDVQLPLDDHAESPNSVRSGGQS